MKKVVLVVALALLGLTSCKKDYTCECKLHVIDEDGLIHTFSDLPKTTISSISRDKATEDCKEYGRVAEISSDIISECNLNY